MINHIFNEELSRLEKLAFQYENILKGLPKGAISPKKRSGATYMYWAYRVKDKIKFDYLGKESSPAAKEAKKQYAIRRDYMDKLRTVNRKIREIKKALHGLRR